VTLQEFDERIRARAAAAAVDVKAGEVTALYAYFRILAHWNSTINLTALPLDNPTDQTFDRLLIEPLVAATFVENAPQQWLDLGSGGGSPAIPIKIAKPLLRLIMIEAKTRKAAFLREAARQLGLSETTVENVRFEDVTLAPPADLITVRAVRLDEAFFATTRKLRAPTGRLFVFHAQDSAIPHHGLKRTQATPTLSMFHVEQTS
jgi:16S rRNA (guanine527-N7)-methyltransferase